MSTKYSLGGVTGALGVIGACMSSVPPVSASSRRSIVAVPADIVLPSDMLFTGSGEAFNVCEAQRPCNRHLR